jgi:two-component system, OmpR family, sensor histidine kinase KdpD
MQLPLSVRTAISCLTIGAITLLFVQIVPANAMTVGLTYLVAILLIAGGWGAVEATTSSVLAAVSLNYFFLPPQGTLTIADPQNWVALTAFLITTIVASQLSVRARWRHAEALTRQRHLERLYDLSRALLLAPDATSLTFSVARQIAQSFDVPSVAVYDRRNDSVSKAGPIDVAGIDESLRNAALRSVEIRDEAAHLAVIPLRLGGEPIGSLAIGGVRLDDTVFQSIANLAAIGLERARSQELGARAEAARQSGELRATVLDALAHEFKTPLTSIKAAAGDMLATLSGDREHELAAIVAEEANRLQGLVSDAVQMLRIESSGFVVRRERHSLARLVAAALDELAGPLNGHVVVNSIRPEATIDADGDLLRLALRQLLNNAAQYSPPTSRIEIEAADGAAAGLIVRNTGSSIPPQEQERIFERFYRGVAARKVPGTGMGLAIVKQIAAAHGGTVTVSSAAAGTEFRLSLPQGDPIA